MESHISCSIGDVVFAAVHTTLRQDRVSEGPWHFDWQGICIWTTANLTGSNILRVLFSNTFICLIMGLIVGLPSSTVLVDVGSELVLILRHVEVGHFPVWPHYLVLSDHALFLTRCHELLNRLRG